MSKSKSTTTKFYSAEDRAEAIKSTEETIESLRKKASSASSKAVRAQHDSNVADNDLAKAREHLTALKRSRVSTRKEGT